MDHLHVWRADRAASGDVTPVVMRTSDAVMFVTLRGDCGISSVIRCSFCGKSPNDVRVILTSDESAICDECVFLAFDTIGGQKGYFYQRVAYSIFKLVATIGRFLARCSWLSRSSD